MRVGAYWLVMMLLMTGSMALNGRDSTDTAQTVRFVAAVTFGGLWAEARAREAAAVRGEGKDTTNG